MAKHEIFLARFKDTLPDMSDTKSHLPEVVDDTSAVRSYLGHGGVLTYGAQFRSDECGLITPVGPGTEKHEADPAKAKKAERFLVDPSKQVARIFETLDSFCHYNRARPIMATFNIRTNTDDPATLEKIAGALAADANSRGIGVVDHDLVVTDYCNAPVMVNATFLSACPRGMANIASPHCISWNRSQIKELKRELMQGTILALPGDVALPQGKVAINKTIEDVAGKFIVVSPEGRIVGMSASSLGHKAPGYAIIDKCGAAANDVLSAAADPCLGSRVAPRALVVFADHVGGRRFEELEITLLENAKNMRLNPHLVYSAFPEQLSGFWKGGPMFFVDYAVVTLNDVAKSTGMMSDYKWLTKKDEVYAITGLNPRLSGLDELLEVLQKKNNGKNFAKLEDTRFLLREFYARSLPPLYDALAPYVDNGMIRNVFVPTPGESAVQKLGRALQESEFELEMSGLRFHPVEDYLQYYRSRDPELSGVDEEYAVRQWPCGILGLVTVRKGIDPTDKIDLNGLGWQRVGQIRKRSSDRGGLIVAGPSGVKYKLS